jgi:uncharacterized protein (TIGR02391 family)
MEDKVLTEVLGLVDEFIKEHRTELDALSQEASALRNACAQIQRSWSGSFAGWHGKMYFRDYQVPSIYERFSGEWGGINGVPEGWQEREPEQVTGKINSLVGGGFSAEAFEDKVVAFRKVVEVWKGEVDVALSPLTLDDSFSKEKALLATIEGFEFGRTKGELIHAGLPGRMMSRDSEAIQEGMYIATWLYYDAVGQMAEETCEAINELAAAIHRLSKLLAKKGAVKKVADTNRLHDLHPAIYEKCHELYEKGAYAEGVERGFKVVRDTLRKLTGHETGSEAFGKGRLHIKGAAAPNVDTDFNEAVKFLTMAIDRFRNEKAHTSDAKIDDPCRALEYLCLSSLAMRLLDAAEVLS